MKSLELMDSPECVRSKGGSSAGDKRDSRGRCCCGHEKGCSSHRLRAKFNSEVAEPDSSLDQVLTMGGGRARAGLQPWSSLSTFTHFLIRPSSAELSHVSSRHWVGLG